MSGREFLRTKRTNEEIPLLEISEYAIIVIPRLCGAVEGGGGFRCYVS